MIGKRRTFRVRKVRLAVSVCAVVMMMAASARAEWQPLGIYRITGQKTEVERTSDGSVTNVIRVDYETTTNPETRGYVTVPKTLLATPVDYAAAVKSAVEAAVAGHAAVAALGS